MRSKDTTVAAPKGRLAFGLLLGKTISTPDIWFDHLSTVLWCSYL